MYVSLSVSCPITFLWLLFSLPPPPVSGSPGLLITIYYANLESYSHLNYLIRREVAITFFFSSMQYYYNILQSYAVLVSMITIACSSKQYDPLVLWTVCSMITISSSPRQYDPLVLCSMITISSSPMQYDLNLLNSFSV